MRKKLIPFEKLPRELPNTMDDYVEWFGTQFQERIEDHAHGIHIFYLYYFLEDEAVPNDLKTKSGKALDWGKLPRQFAVPHNEHDTLKEKGWYIIPLDYHLLIDGNSATYVMNWILRNTKGGWSCIDPAHWAFEDPVDAASFRMTFDHDYSKERR